jgi:hypothetical protein
MRTIKDIDEKIASLLKQREELQAIKAPLTPDGARALRDSIDQLNEKLRLSWRRLRDGCPHPPEDRRQIEARTVEGDCDGLFARTFPARVECGLCGAAIR